MKTIKTMFVAIVALLTVNVVMGSDSGKIRVEMKSTMDDFAIVELADANISEIHINVTDGDGEIIYDKKTKLPVNQLRTRYDFSGLEDGLYRFTVKIDKQRTVNTFEIDGGDMNVIETRKTVDPFFEKDGDVFKLSFLNFHGENVRMYMYDRSKDKLLYQKELGTDFTIHHAVDISNLRWGDYEVVLANDEDFFEHWVSVR